MGDWKKCQLGMVADIQCGPFGSQLHESDYVLSDGTPIVTVEHLGNRHFTTQNLPLVSNEDKERLSRYVMSCGDVIFSRVGSVDRCSFVDQGSDGWMFSGRCIRVRPNKEIAGEYLYYYLSNPRVKQIVRDMAVGTTMPSINSSIMGDVPIEFPPLPTQRKIAAVLGALDDKIENNRKICANLEAQAQAIFKSWFVDFEPFGGKMPQGWKMGKLGDVAIYRQGKIAANELTAETYYSTENMLPDKQGLMPATSLPQIGEVPVCEKGDVLISNIRPYFKKICFSWSHGGHSPDVLCLAAKNDNMRYWLYRQLWDDAFFAYVMSSAKGTKMPRGDKEQILAYGMAIPNENDVARFNAVIEPMCESIVSKGIESRALAATRDALLPKLMSGEIDVEKVEVA